MYSSNKRSQATVWMLVSLMLFAFVGCGYFQKDVAVASDKVTIEDVQRDADRAAVTAAKYAMQSADYAKQVADYREQSREEFAISLERKLNEADVELAKLDIKVATLKADKKANWEQRTHALKDMREKARAQLSSIRTASGEAWLDIRDGATQAWYELSKACREAVDEFDSRSVSS